MAKSSKKNTPKIVPDLVAPPPAVVNEIVERGFVPSADEYQLLSGAVMLAAKAAKESGAPAIYQGLQQILGRIAQTVQAPGGLRPDQIARYRKRAADGLKERNATKIADGVRDLIAATCRTDPDPADKVAVYLLQLVADLMREHGNIGVGVLTRLDVELADAHEAWNASKWPAASDLLAWLRQTLAIGIENLQADRDPWPTDGDEVEDDEGEDEGDDEDESDSTTDA